MTDNVPSSTLGDDAVAVDCSFRPATSVIITMGGANDSLNLHPITR